MLIKRCVSLLLALHYLSSSKYKERIMLLAIRKVLLNKRDTPKTSRWFCHYDLRAKHAFAHCDVSLQFRMSESSPAHPENSPCDHNTNTIIIFGFVPFVCLCFAIICCEGSSASVDRKKMAVPL